MPPCKEAPKTIEKKLIAIRTSAKQRPPLIQLSRSITSTRLINQTEAARAKSTSRNEILAMNDMFTSKEHQSKSYDIYLDEIKALKKRIDELETQLKQSQKVNKDKEKLIEELNRKFCLILKQVRILSKVF